MILIMLVGSFALSGCSEIAAQVEKIIEPGQPTVESVASETPIAAAIETETSATATPAGPQTLTIWVPPQFDPQSGSEAGTILQKRLRAFSVDNPGVEVVVRVKALTGQSSLLNSLTAASEAVESSEIPSLVALPRADMETAALKGLIFPLDELSSTIDETDWYDYSKNLALIQGSTFGIPFAGNAVVLVYRPSKIGAAPQGWNDILSRGQPLALPAADPNSLVTFTLYQSAGGTILNSQNQPSFQEDALQEAFNLYAEGGKQGAFPAWLSQYTTDQEVWQAYQNQTTPWVITWSSNYFSELPVDSTVLPLPAMGEQSYTTASGWLWTLSDPLPERRELSAQLAEYLTDSDFLSNWTPVSGYLPTRPSTLLQWSDQDVRSLLGQIILSSNIIPDQKIYSNFGPILKDSVLQIIEKQGDPAQLTTSTIEKLNGSIVK